MKVINDVNELFSNKNLKYKEHPGIMKPRLVDQPSWLQNTVLKILHGNEKYVLYYFSIRFYIFQITNIFISLQRKIFHQKSCTIAVED